MIKTVLTAAALATAATSAMATDFQLQCVHKYVLVASGDGFIAQEVENSYLFKNRFSLSREQYSNLILDGRLTSEKTPDTVIKLNDGDTSYDITLTETDYEMGGVVISGCRIK